LERINDVNDLARLEEEEDDYEGEILPIDEDLARVTIEALEEIS
jgi:hypothetical protein